MKNFIVLYKAPVDMMKQASSMSPEDRKNEMDSWMAWAEKCGKNLIDMGAPLGSSMKLSPGGNATESGNDIVGYSIISAENMEKAQSLMSAHPHLAWNADCGIKLYETMQPQGK